MNNLDDWLNSLGISEGNREITVPASSDTVSVISQQHQEESSSSSIPLDDFNDILADNGFQEPEYDEAEEVEEEGEEEENTIEYNENGGEGRDLDAEEDRDWDGLIESGSITPVNMEMHLESGVEPHDIHFHLPNGEVIDVPVIYGGTNQDINENSDEEVSQDDMEAFDVAEQQEPSITELLLAPNSSTLLINDATSRFSGTEWYNAIQKAHIILAGCGGIGSWAVLQLARMNPEALFMYDDDIVEQANMSGQLYCIEDIGKAKVDAMANMIRSYTTMRSIYAIKDKFTQNCEAGDIMICGFDNMTARRVFFSKWLEHVNSKSNEERYKCLLLDGRLSIDTLQVFCITGDNEWALSEYQHKYLFTDAEADATQCSLKQTTYLACMIGSVIVNLFTNWVANTLNPAIPYDLPFFTEYDAQNMIFKTIK